MVSTLQQPLLAMYKQYNGICISHATEALQMSIFSSRIFLNMNVKKLKIEWNRMELSEQLVSEHVSPGLC